jgi:hypothetical protein
MTCPLPHAKFDIKGRLVVVQAARRSVCGSPVLPKVRLIQSHGLKAEERTPAPDLHEWRSRRESAINGRAYLAVGPLSQVCLLPLMPAHHALVTLHRFLQRTFLHLELPQANWLAHSSLTLAASATPAYSMLRI